MFDSWRAKKRIQKLIQSWQEYRQVVTAAHAGDRNAAGDEERFLQLKADIASQLQSLTAVLPPNAAVEANSHFAGITRLFQNQLTLQSSADGPEWNQEQFDRTWQDHYLYLNKLKSMRLERQKPRVDPKVAVPTGFPGMNRPRRRTWRKLPRLVVSGLIFMALIALIAWGFGVRWEGGARFVVTNQAPLGHFMDGLLVSLNTWWGHLESLFAPVVLAYGSVVSIVLVGVFLLSLGYWVFIHS